MISPLGTPYYSHYFENDCISQSGSVHEDFDFMNFNTHNNIINIDLPEFFLDKSFHDNSFHQIKQVTNNNCWRATNRLSEPIVSIDNVDAFFVGTEPSEASV